LLRIGSLEFLIYKSNRNGHVSTPTQTDPPGDDFPENDPPEVHLPAKPTSELTEVPEDAGADEKMDHAYKVELDIFEGPLDLLLYLVKRDEIDIYDISIERITTQYMSFIDTFKMLNIGLAGEFLVMAANLCYIKSRMMLPKHVQPVTEEVDEEDPRWDLIKQLIEYKKFKEAAHHLGFQEEATGKFYRNIPPKIEVEKERPLSEDVGIFDLIRAFQNILDRFEDDEGLGEIIDDRITVSERIEYILEKIPSGENLNFYTLFDGIMTKAELIVTFLAMLELMKLNLIRVVQETILGEIIIYRPEGGEGESLYQRFTRT
jgi:segregation and condensation protein A